MAHFIQLWKDIKDGTAHEAACYDSLICLSQTLSSHKTAMRQDVGEEKVSATVKQFAQQQQRRYRALRSFAAAPLSCFLNEPVINVAVDFKVCFHYVKLNLFISTANELSDSLSHYGGTAANSWSCGDNGARGMRARLFQCNVDTHVFSFKQHYVHSCGVTFGYRQAEIEMFC